MDVLVAFVAGLAVGTLVTALTMRRTPEGGLALKPSRRQERILASLPPDPLIPSIQDLVREEAQALGVLDVTGGEDIALHVRLRVWKRDHHPERCPAGRWVFRVTTGVPPADAGIEDVALECEEAAP